MVLKARRKRRCLFRLLLLVIICLMTYVIAVAIVMGKDQKTHYVERLTAAQSMVFDHEVIPHTNYPKVEEDSYGRYVFLHSGGDINGGNFLIIIQKVDDKNVYVYSEYGLLKNDGAIHWNAWQKITTPIEGYEEFKKANDWNQPLNEEKMTAIPLN